MSLTISDFGVRTPVREPAQRPHASSGPSRAARPASEGSRLSSQLRDQQTRLADDEQAEREARIAAVSRPTSQQSQDAYRLAQARTAVSRAEVARTQAQIMLEKSQTTTRDDATRTTARKRLDSANQAVADAQKTLARRTPPTPVGPFPLGTADPSSSSEPGALLVPTATSQVAAAIPAGNAMSSALLGALNAQRAPSALTSLASPLQSPTAVADWAKKSIETAAVDSRVADKLHVKLGKATRDDDPAGWTAYDTRRGEANEHETTAELAAQAQLRLVYRGDTANAAATQDEAHRLADQYRSDPLAQKEVSAALHTVLTETPVQRATNAALNTVHMRRSAFDDASNGLAAHRRGVNATDVAHANARYQAAQDTLLAATQGELPTAVSRTTQDDCDPLGEGGGSLAARYKNDPEYVSVVQAATGIARIQAAAGQSNAQRIGLLGEVLPVGVDPSVKRLVMADHTVRATVQGYIDDATTSIRSAYAAHGTLAASDALANATDVDQHAGVTPQIAAQIVNANVPTIAHIVTDVSRMKMRGPGGASNEEASIDGVSRAVDAAAAGSDVVRKTYDSPEIQQAVTGTARLVAQHFMSSETLAGFQDSVKHGYATLALASAVQLKGLRAQDVKAMPGMSHLRDFEALQQDQLFESAMLDAVDTGISQFRTLVKNTSTRTIAALEPSAVEGRYASVATDANFLNGQHALFAGNKGLADATKAGKAAFDSLGYRITRTTEAVSFYQDSLRPAPARPQAGDADSPQDRALASVATIAQVSAARDRLVNDPTVFGVVQLSDSAQFRQASQIARGMLSDDQKNGSVTNTRWGPTGQQGDFAEMVAESYVMRNSGYRSAKLPNLEGAGIWLLSGVPQALNLAYLRTLHFGKGPGDFAGLIRKSLLLGLVGGFTALHLTQVAMAVARVNADTFTNKNVSSAADWIDAKINAWTGRIAAAAKSDASWGLYMKPGTARDRWTLMSELPTEGLTTFLASMMGIAAGWDASGIFFNATQLDGTQRDPFHLVTQPVNLTNDLILLRLQLRETAIRALGREALSDPLFAAQMAKRGLTPREIGLAALEDDSIKTGAIRSWLAKSAGLEALDSVVPIGLFVNVGYWASSVGNAGHDHNKAIQTDIANDKLMLKGMGVSDSAADVIASHHWLTGDATADPFVQDYQSAGGDPAQFVNYVNGLPHNDLVAELNAADTAPTSAAQRERDAVDKPYLALPNDPTTDPRLLAPNIRYDLRTKRYEDPVTQTWWDHGIWRQDLSITPQECTVPALTKGVLFYRPSTLELHTQNKATTVGVDSAAGFHDYLVANDIPLPPTTPSLVPPRQADYLTLPTNPATPGASTASRFSRDTDGRYRDSTTHMTYGPDGKWYADPNAPGANKSPPDIVSYDPQTRRLYAKGGRSIVLTAADAGQFNDWIHARGDPSSPNAPADNGQALPPTPKSAKPVNVYTVKPGDSIDRIAGSDPRVEARIYALNPWLNPRMASDLDPVNRLTGQNPNYIDPGQPLTLPKGYKPPKA